MIAVFFFPEEIVQLDIQQALLTVVCQAPRKFLDTQSYRCGLHPTFLVQLTFFCSLKGLQGRCKEISFTLLVGGYKFHL